MFRIVLLVAGCSIGCLGTDPAVSSYGLALAACKQNTSDRDSRLACYEREKAERCEDGGIWADASDRCHGQIPEEGAVK